MMSHITLVSEPNHVSIVVLVIPTLYPSLEPSRNGVYRFSIQAKRPSKLNIITYWLIYVYLNVA